MFLQMFCTFFCILLPKHCNSGFFSSFALNALGLTIRQPKGVRVATYLYVALPWKYDVKGMMIYHLTRKLGSRMALMPIRKKGPQKIVMNCTHHPYGRESKKLLTTMKEKTSNVCQSGSLHKYEQIIHPQLQALATPNVHFFADSRHMQRMCQKNVQTSICTWNGPSVAQRFSGNYPKIEFFDLYFHISSQCCLVWGWHGPDYLQ